VRELPTLYNIYTDPARSKGNREPGCRAGCAIFVRKPQEAGDLALSLNKLITGGDIDPHWEGTMIAGEITLNRNTGTQDPIGNELEDTPWICAVYNHSDENKKIQHVLYRKIGDFLRTGL
jgi:hypothetical protein